MMIENIKNDLEYIKSAGTKNICHNPHYIKKIEELIKNFSKNGWIATAQYHSAESYIQSFPETEINPEVNQVIRLSGGYVIEVLPEIDYKWKKCVYEKIFDVIDCIFLTETQENEK